MSHYERWLARIGERGLDDRTLHNTAKLCAKLDRIPGNRRRTHGYRVFDKDLDEFCSRVKTVTTRSGGSLYVGLRPPNGQDGPIIQCRGESAVAAELGLRPLTWSETNFDEELPDQGAVDAEDAVQGKRQHS